MKAALLFLVATATAALTNSLSLERPRKTTFFDLVSCAEVPSCRQYCLISMSGVKGYVFLALRHDSYIYIYIFIYIIVY
jgi:hypothetical protein